LLVLDSPLLASGSVSLAWVVKTKVRQINILIWIGLLQSHHLLLNLKLELIMNSNRGLSSGLDLGFLYLTESLKVANCAHDLLGEDVDVLRLLSHVDIKRLSEHLLQRDSLLEQEVKVSYLNLEIAASLSLLSDGSRLVCWQLIEKSLH